MKLVPQPVGQGKAAAQTRMLLRSLAMCVALIALFAPGPAQLCIRCRWTRTSTPPSAWSATTTRPRASPFIPPWPPAASAATRFESPKTSPASSSSPPRRLRSASPATTTEGRQHQGHRPPPAVRDCLTCHDPHTSDNKNQLLKPLSGGEKENLCLSCHQTGLHVSEKGSRHAALDMGCDACHLTTRPAPIPRMRTSSTSPSPRPLSASTVTTPRTPISQKPPEPALRHGQLPGVPQSHQSDAPS